MFTYERDDGLNRSWIDHVLCSQSLSTLFTHVHAVHSGAILSDHCSSQSKLTYSLFELRHLCPLNGCDELTGLKSLPVTLRSIVQWSLVIYLLYLLMLLIVHSLIALFIMAYWTHMACTLSPPCLLVHLTAFPPGQSLPLVKVWLVGVNLSVGYEIPQSSGTRFGRK